MTELRIDIVSDVVCPWCVIGYKRLEIAMQELSGEMRFDVAWKPFELNPDMPPEGEDGSLHIMRKYGISKEQAVANRERIASIGQELGVVFQVGDGRRVYNTFDAHRALYWAFEHDAQTPFSLALFYEYFTEGLNPSDPTVLRRVAESLSLDGEELTRVIASNRYADEVRLEQQRYRNAGINSVPAFIINDSYLISGGQEPKTFISAFREIAVSQK